MRALGILFYTFVLTLIGASLILIALFPFKVEPQLLNDALYYLQSSLLNRGAVGLSGVLLIIVSFSFAQLILGHMQREKTIAFTTSTGQVTIALSAVEDLIKRISADMPEIKELKPNVIASKKGLIVDLRVILRSEANIPELTATLQEVTRSKLQEVLGLEEQITIKIHIAKITMHEGREKKRRDAEECEEPRPAPYRGYGRT